MSDELQSFIEPELEARVIAFILGEASDFEREELERIIHERPEVGIWKRRMEAVHGLLGEAAKSGDDSEWKLSSTRREKVLAVIGSQETLVEQDEEGREKRVSKFQWRAVSSLAACFAVTGLIWAFMNRGSDRGGFQALAVEEKVEPKSPALLTFSDNKTFQQTGNEEFVFEGGGNPNDEKSKASAKNQLAQIGDAIAGNRITHWGFQKAERPELSGTAGKNSENDSSEYGEGWKDYGSLVSRELIRRQGSVSAADSLLKKGRNLYAKGDYEKATQYYRFALDELPYGEATQQRREVFTDHLNDGAVALAQVNRRNGKYQEARDLLKEVQKNDLDNPAIGKQLEYLDDPIRTSPPLTYEHTRNVDKVRRDLYKGEGFYNLGLYDKADEEFKEVLRTDPHNKAARRWMERTASIKDNYYNAAYDQTRAQMLMEVDRAWELAVPPVKEDSEKLSVADTKKSKPATSSLALSTMDIAGLPQQEEATDKNLFFDSGVSTGRAKKTPPPAMPAPVMPLARAAKPKSKELNELERLSVFELKEIAGKQPGVDGSSLNGNGSTDLAAYAGSRFRLKKGKEVIGGQADWDTDGFAALPEFTQEDEAIVTAAGENEIFPVTPATPTETTFDVPQLAESLLPAQDEIVWSDEVDPFADGGEESAGILARKATKTVNYSDANRLDQKPIAQKLRNIILPEVNFENVSVDDAIKMLQEKAKAQDFDAYDKSSAGVEIKVRKPRVSTDFGLDAFSLDAEGDGLGAVSDPGGARVDSLYLKNVPLGVALQYIADKTKLRYKLDDDGSITMLPLDATETDEIITRSWDVPSNLTSFLDSGGLIGGEDDPFASDPFADRQLEGGGLPARKSMKELLIEQGLKFPEGSLVQYLPETGQLLVRNTPSNLELVEAIVEASAEEVAQERHAEGAHSVTYKLGAIRIPILDFEDATVNEALDFLRARTRELDSTTLIESDKGVNFTIFGDTQSKIGEKKIDKLFLKDVLLGTALNEISQKAGLKVSLDDFSIILGTGDLSKPEVKADESFESKIAAEKLQMTRVPVIDFKETTLAEALEFLGVRARELEASTISSNVPKGIDFEIEGERLHNLKVDQLFLKSVPIGVAVGYVAKKIGVSYRIENGKVIFFDPQAKELEKNNFETAAATKPDSTFSLNVSDVSFKLAKAALAKGQWPEKAKIRVEEFVNALNYQDVSPSQSQKINCVIEQGAHPFMQQRNLMRVAMKTAALGRNATTPLRLTILLDRSGSMERADRAESVRRAFDVLARQLNASDEVTLVAFDRIPRLLAERVKGNECQKLVQIMRQAPAEGGTNLEQALTTGLQLAKQQYLESAQNRIILLTDGAANLGDAKPEALSRVVERMRQQGVAFDACGVGADGLNDEILESLARKGDGRYYFLDRPEDADAGFARQIAGALRPAAKNVKVQVIFNPERVGKYRLYGFEKHLLKKEDFRNDSVDAAEMAAEESGVAMYHYEPLPEGRGDVGTVAVRFQDASTGRMIERTWTIPYEPEMCTLNEAKPGLKLAASAVLFGEKLKGSIMGERVELPKLIETINGLKPTFKNQTRFNELHQMMQQAR